MSIYTDFIVILVGPIMQEMLLLGEKKKDYKLRIQTP